MATLAVEHKIMLQNHARAIVHLRRQIEANRFGLVFGAGLSKSFGTPTWDELVKFLAEDPKVRGQRVLDTLPPRAGLPYRTEMLFEHYKQCRYKETSSAEHHTRELEYRIAADWREIVRGHLYGKVSQNIETLLANHPFIETYLPLIESTHMTIVYNFDDFIEQALLHRRATRSSGGDERSFETITNPWAQFRKLTGIIYHPNGIIPRNSLEAPSDRFVFSEASYAEQLMGIYAGDQAGLLNHFSKHTCLFVGISLEDETLRSVLMQGAKACPGNFHYYVHFVKDDAPLDEEQRCAISRANFKVYNLITLFLTSSEIRTLGELLDTKHCSSDDFSEFARHNGIELRYRFYITGALGVGKSTSINHFRNLVVFDEWIDERPPILAKDWENLTTEEQLEADSWIIGQFEKKNTKLRREREGLFMLDRGPLDPVAFTPRNAWSEKAKNILSALSSASAGWRVEPGRVIFLKGDAEELALRMVITQRKDYTADKLQKMEDSLADVYGTDGVVTCDTRGLTPVDVARRIAEIVHLEKYSPVCDLHDRLDKIMGDI